MRLLGWKTPHVVVVYLLICLLVVAVAAPTASGLVDESGEAGVEVPEAVTVEVEETHPLPEVGATMTNTIIILINEPF